MAVDPPPLVGFNNNVRYRGLRFHIQTEDSGIRRPHIATHLFANGGQVIKSVRRDYTEHVDSPDRAKVVRRMMMEQHKIMAVALRRGNLDDLLGDAPSLGVTRVSVVQSDAAEQTLSSDAAPPRPFSTDGADSSLWEDREGPQSETMTSLRPNAPEHQEVPLHIPLASPAWRGTRPPSQFALDAVGSADNGAPGSLAPETQTSPQAPPVTGRKPVGRPSPRMLTKPSGASLFGTDPEASLDDAILGYVSAHSKRTTGNGR